MNLNSIIHDIDIIKEAVNNGDLEDATQMLDDIQVELKIIVSLED